MAFAIENKILRITQAKTFFFVKYIAVEGKTISLVIYLFKDRI
jgi:hypothetical protein